MKVYPKHFYLYKGGWSDLFCELVEMLEPSEEKEEQKFAIWAPKDKMKDHCLIIVYGMPLADSYCYQKNIWRSDEDVFNSFYLSYAEEFNIYGYKEAIAMPFMMNNVA